MDLPSPTLEPALRDWLGRVAEHLGDTQGDVRANLVGDLAYRLWTGDAREVDARIEWSKRIALPPWLMHFLLPAAGGAPGEARIEHGFSECQGCYAEDWHMRAVPLERIGSLDIRVISPLDLAVSKVIWFEARDRADVVELCRRGLVVPDIFEERAHAALPRYVGGEALYGLQLKEAIQIVRDEATS